MSKRRRKKTRRPPAARETRAADAMTVFWMTSLSATVLGQIASLAARAVIALTEPYPPLVLLSNLLLLIAAATGVLCLGLTPVVLRVRQTPPPRAITWFAVAVSLLPFATLAVLLAL